MSEDDILSTDGIDGILDLNPILADKHTIWNIFGGRVPRSQIIFFSQIVIIYSVIFASILNLSLKNGENT